jgi:hypothetical protein
MPPEPQNHHVERHEDLERIDNSLNRLIVGAVRTILVSLIPPILIGLWALCGMYFNQQRQLEKMTALTAEVQSLREDNKIISDKVLVMWFHGGWQSKLQGLETTDK